MNTIAAQSTTPSLYFSPVGAVLKLSTYSAGQAREGDLVLDGTAGIAFPELESDLLPGDPAFYPDKSILEKKIARRLGVSERQVLLTAGADNAIETALKTSLCGGRDFILPVPTFEMIERYALFTGCTIKKVDWQSGAFPAGKVIEMATPQCGAIMVVTPNNPTGLTARPETVTRIARAVPQALLVADLAYVEFAEEDPTPELLEEPNIVIVRTLSKAWGMAGLRLGYAVGDSQVIEWMRRVLSPYPASSLSLKAAAARIFSAEWLMKKKAERVKTERRKLEDLFSKYGISFLPSEANFILAATIKARAIYSRLQDRRVKVRSWSAGTPLANCLRISCPGDESSFNRLFEALSESLEGLT